MVIFKINSLLSGLFGYQNQTEQPIIREAEEEPITMEEDDTVAASSSSASPAFIYTIEDTFGDEISIKSPLNAMTMSHHNTRRRNSKRFVIGDEGDDVEPTPEIETLLTVPNPEWLQQSAKLKPGTTLTYVFIWIIGVNFSFFLLR